MSGVLLSGAIGACVYDWQEPAVNASDGGVPLKDSGDHPITDGAPVIVSCGAPNACGDTKPGTLTPCPGGGAVGPECKFVASETGTGCQWVEGTCPIGGATDGGTVSIDASVKQDGG